MLDDVERRAFLVQPARKHPVPALVGALDVELDEGAGQSLDLPRSGRIAGAQAHRDVLYPNRLAGLQREIADDPVALVEQRDHRHPLGHRRHARGINSRRERFGDDLILGHLLVLPAVASGNRQTYRGKSKNASPAHAWSGVQAL